MAVRMLESVVRAIARRAGRSIVRRETNSATRCCESAAEPPLPHTISLRPACMASAVSLPASTTASWMDWSLSTAVMVAMDWPSCFLTRSLMIDSKVSARLTGRCRQNAEGWCIRLGERGGVLKVDAIEFHGIGTLLDLSVNRSDVLANHAEEHQLERRDEKYSDQHRREAHAEGRPEDELKNEVDQGNEERYAGTEETGKRRQAKRDLRMVNNSEHADVVEGIPVVLGDAELASRLVVEQLDCRKADVGDHPAKVRVGVVEGLDQFNDF